MRNFLFVLSYSLYLFFILGFFFHTSAHPQIFNKYTIKYAILLLALIISFPIFIGLIIFLKRKTSIKYKKKKFYITPLHKFIAYVLLGFLLIILPVEFLLRHQYKSVESNTYQYSLENFHPFLQFQLGNMYTTNINKYRFRGDEINYEKPEGTYRIFVLGGSTVLNRGMPFEKTSVKLLETKLKKKFPDKKFEVINAGVDAYTSEHSLIQYFFKIKDFNPDMVIMWHGINDLIYSCNPKERSYGTFQKDYSHMFSADASMAFDHFKPAPLISIKLLTYDFLTKFLEYNWYSDLKELHKKNNPFEGFYTEATKSQQYDMKNYPSLQSYERNLQSLINATKADNVTLILGNQPNLYDTKLNKNELKAIFFPRLHCSREDEKYPSLSSMEKAIRAFNNVTKKESYENNVHFVDLDSSVPKKLEFFTDDVHFTATGNEKVAGALYEFIVSQELITN